MTISHGSVKSRISGYISDPDKYWIRLDTGSGYVHSINIHIVALEIVNYHFVAFRAYWHWIY